MFLNLYIKLLTKNNKNQNFNLNLVDFFKNTLIENDFGEDFHNASYMTESNNCITLEFSFFSSIDFSEKDKITSFLSNLVLQNNIPNFDFVHSSEYTTFFIFKNNFLNFYNSQHEQIVFADDLFGIATIQTNINSCYEIDDKPSFYFSFFDRENKLIEISPCWIEKANESLAKHFTAHDSNDIKLKIVDTILFGSKPDKEITRLLNDKLLISKTEYMDEFSFFEKNKIRDNIIVSTNY